MTTRLNQLIALRKGVQARLDAQLTALYHRVKRVDALTGIVKEYHAFDDEDRDRPDTEMRLVQTRVPALIEELRDPLVRFLDVTMAIELTNATAAADVVVPSLDGSESTPLLTDVPVTYLLTLERQLIDWHTLIKALPVNSADKEWDWDGDAGVFRSAPTKTVRGRKSPVNHIKHPGNEHHPPQVELLWEDKPIGEYTTTNLSGAITPALQRELLDRVERLQRAVKTAREDANSANVRDRQVGAALFNYVFASATDPSVMRPRG